MNYQEQINELVDSLPLRDEDKLLLAREIGQIIVTETVKQQSRDQGQFEL